MKAPIVILEATAIAHVIYIARQAVLPKSVDLWYTPLTASQYYNLGLWYWEGAQSKNRPLKALGSARRLAAWQAAGSLAAAWQAAGRQPGRQLAGSLAGGWPAGWQAGRLAGWLAGWQAGRLAARLPRGVRKVTYR